jgi:hypothetical protein
MSLTINKVTGVDMKKTYILFRKRTTSFFQVTHHISRNYITLPPVNVA